MNVVASGCKRMSWLVGVAGKDTDLQTEVMGQVHLSIFRRPHSLRKMPCGNIYPDWGLYVSRAS